MDEKGRDVYRVKSLKNKEEFLEDLRNWINQDPAERRVSKKITGPRKARSPPSGVAFASDSELLAHPLEMKCTKPALHRGAGL